MQGYGGSAFLWVFEILLGMSTLPIHLLSVCTANYKRQNHTRLFSNESVAGQFLQVSYLNPSGTEIFKSACSVGHFNTISCSFSVHM